MDNSNKKKNILILTPDGVGGTFLKNVTFFYSQFNNEIPLIDASHIELGIELNDNKTGFIRKKLAGDNQAWSEINDIIELADFPMIAKISYHNFAKRNDHGDFKKFAEYLNKNFYIISANRKNLFEHALSWSVNHITDLLNVFDHDDKINTFARFYTNKICIDPDIIEMYLENYVEYKKWCNEYFDIDSSYIYEDHVKNIENYILSLPIFEDSKKISWYEKFGITFNDWNYCHYQLSNITEIFLQKNNYFLNLSLSYDFEKDEKYISDKIKECSVNILDKYNKVAGTDWPNILSVEDLNQLPDYILKELELLNFNYYVNKYNHYLKLAKGEYTLPFAAFKNEKENKQIIFDIDIKNSTSQSKFLKHYEKNYLKAANWIFSIQESIDKKNIPIKKQTLFDKTQIIENFNECLLTYNKWAIRNNFSVIDQSTIESYINQEQNFWNRK